MFTRWPRCRSISLVLAILLSGLFSVPAGAQGPPKKRVQKGKVVPRKSKAEPRKDEAAPHKAQFYPGNKSRVRRVPPTKSYVHVRRDYGHVRVSRPHRRPDGFLNARPIIVRSARVSPVVLERFEDRRREQIQLTIRYFKEGRRDRALEIWGGFVGSLADYREPIDLDDVMLYVAREGCVYEDTTFLFRAAKLEFLRESRERLEFYIDQLYDQREACAYGPRPCSTATLRDVEAELSRARADLQILGIEAQIAGDEFERAVEASRGYESRFAAVFEDLYREVEIRIRFEP